MFGRRAFIVLVAAATALAACGDDEEITPEEPEPEQEEGPERSLQAPVATITVDGDPSDWEATEGLDLTLEAIQGETVEPRAASVKIAHDDESIYVLFEVTDDYNRNPEDPHLSGSAAVMWSVEEGAGEHMGAEEPERGVSLGLVDLWHWELECAAGEQNGGAVSGPGDGDPGNDDACNLDDEWATTPTEREDDVGTGAENSLLGVWSHTSPTEDSDGTWIFEIQRPLQTGDTQDAQFAAGQAAFLALAYWDPDNGPEGWNGAQHVESANQGWIEVVLA